MNDIQRVKYNPDYSIDDLILFMDYVHKLHLLLSELSQDVDQPEQYFLMYKDTISIKSNVCFDYIHLIKNELDKLFETANQQDTRKIK